MLLVTEPRRRPSLAVTLLIARPSVSTPSWSSSAHRRSTFWEIDAAPEWLSTGSRLTYDHFMPQLAQVGFQYSP
jgi:hypothetical protein